MVLPRFRRYHRWWFRYGQRALRSGRPVPTLARLRERVVPDRDIAPGVMVVQKDGERNRLHLWIGAVLHGQETDIVEAELTVAPLDQATGDARTQRVPLHWFSMESEKQITGWSAGNRFFHTHVTLDGLPSDAWYRVDVRIPEPLRPHSPALEARCRARTLPAELAVGEPPLRIFTASCYDVDTDTQDRLDKAYTRLFPSTGPDLTWITGDAAYGDAPFWLYATLARHTPRTYALLEYWGSWGMQYGNDADPRGQRRPGMRSVLSNGPNWFVADDHEFWNNWPHATVTSRHSYGNIGKAMMGIVRRAGHSRHPLGPDETVSPPHDPGEDPKDPLVQNYLPVHPDEWGAWSRGAFDLIGSFETRSVRDRTTGRITWGERDDGDPDRPPADGPRDTVHRPLNQVLQTIDLGPVQVALLDTRTRRVRKPRHPVLSTFVDEEFLDEMLALARRAEIFVLVMPEPALVRPAWCDSTDPREPLFTSDIAIHDYWYQYERFWNGLVAARDGRPTVTVGGDIHRTYVAYTEALSMVSVVASPMSPVFGQNLLTTLTEPWRRLLGRVPAIVKDPFEAGSTLVTVDELLCGPANLARASRAGAAVSLACLPKPDADEGGFAQLLLSRPEPHRYRLVTELHRRNPLAEGDRSKAETVEFELRTDVRGPESVTLTPSSVQPVAVPG